MFEQFQVTVDGISGCWEGDAVNAKMAAFFGAIALGAKKGDTINVTSARALTAPERFDVVHDFPTHVTSKLEKV